MVVVKGVMFQGMTLEIIMITENSLLIATDTLTIGKTALVIVIGDTKTLMVSPCLGTLIMTATPIILNTGKATVATGGVGGWG